MSCQRTVDDSTFCLFVVSLSKVESSLGNADQCKFHLLGIVSYCEKETKRSTAASKEHFSAILFSTRCKYAGHQQTQDKQTRAYWQTLAQNARSIGGKYENTERRMSSGT